MKIPFSHIPYFLLFCGTLQAGIIFDFEKDMEGWHVTEDRQEIALSSLYAYSGKQSLKILSYGTRTVCLKYTGSLNLHNFDTLEFAVYLPEDFMTEITFKCYVKDGEWYWFETGKMRVLRGEEKETVINISRHSLEWKPSGHLKGWDAYVKQDIKEFGIMFFFPVEFKGFFFLDDIRFVKAPPCRKKTSIYNFRTSAERLNMFENFEVTFNTSFSPADPFDRNEFLVTAEFIAPSGRITEIPGFFYMDFIRHLCKTGESLYPYGVGEWKIRFSPEEEGEYSYNIKIHRDSETTALQGGSITVDRGKKRGFLRWDEKDPFYLSFRDNTFFYPVGMTLRSPDDRRQAYPYEFVSPENRGTFAYDSYFKKMSAHMQNYVRIWMAAWWLGLEWNPDYSPYYKGLGKYNLKNAWRLDYILDIAQHHGIYINLTLINHGQFSIRPDAEWRDNPYNAANGGMLESPEEFFINDSAIGYFKRRLDYIVSRWGHSDNIVFWELWNEVDLTGNYDTLKVRSWHDAIVPYLKSIDPYNHLITTHYCRRDDDPMVWIMPHLEMLVSNTYTSDIVNVIKEYYFKRKPFEKPMLINEFGSGRNRQLLEANLRGGIWASSMTPMTGVALFWWWPFIDHYDLYVHYEALARYWEGEDRRGKELQLTDASVSGERGVNAEVIGIQNNSKGFFWIYDPAVYNPGRAIRAPQVQSGAVLCVGNMLPGDYTVEFWDTFNGTIVERHIAPLAQKIMELPVPDFSTDIAVKIRKTDR